MKNNILSVFGVVKRPFVWFRRTRRRNKVFVIILLLIAGFVLSGVFLNKNPSSQYQTAEVVRGDIVEVVSETGAVMTGGSVPVYSPTNGIVSEVYVANGDVVSVGGDLVSVESTATEQEVASAYANYLAAKTALDSVNASMYSLQSAMFSAWDAYKNYAEDHESSDERATSEYHTREKDWLAAEANYKNQQGVVSQAQAALNNASLLYQATQNAVVRSTAEGMVANLSVRVGSTVVVSSPTQVGKPLLHITNDGTTEVVVALGESDIAAAQVGQEAVVDVKSVDGKTYRGVVSRVDSVGVSVEGVMKYNVYVEVINADSMLRSGMTADVDIETQRVDNVLLVPNSAVKPYQGGRAVRVVGKKGEVEYIPVQIGIRGASSTEILDGVEEGQEVITSLSNDQLKRGGLF